MNYKSMQTIKKTQKELYEEHRKRETLIATNMSNYLYNYIIEQNKGRKRHAFAKYCKKYSIPTRVMYYLIHETTLDSIALYYVLKITTLNFADKKIVGEVVKDIFSSNLIEKIDYKEVRKKYPKIRLPKKKTKKQSKLK